MPPRCALFVSASEARVGEPLTLTALVHDPDADDTLVSAWSDVGPSGAELSTPSTTSPAGSSAAPIPITTTWTASGTYTISFAVHDAAGAQTGASFTITVLDRDRSTQTGGRSVAASVNTWPRVSAIMASKTLLDPAGDTVELSSVVTDPDSDPLRLTWASDCAGTFGPLGSARTTWRVEPGVAGTDCAVTLTAEDLVGAGGSARGGRAQGRLVVHVGAPPILTHP